MLPLILSTIRTQRKSLIVLLLINALFMLMYVALFPSLKAEAEQLEQLLSAIPDALLVALGSDGSFFTNFDAFIGVRHYSITWVIMLIILAVGVSGSAYAEEIDKGTMDILLAQPLSRIQLFFAKYIGGLVTLMIFVTGSVLVTIPFAAIYDIEVSLKGNLLLLILGCLLAFAIYGMGIMFSAIFSTRGQVGAAMSGILIFMYGFSIFARLESSAEFLQYISYFYFFDYDSALIDQVLDPLAIAVFLLSGLIFTAVGLVRFIRRDI